MQRATDGGNLSVLRAALVDISVPLAASGDSLQFNGVSDPQPNSQGVINIRNINRVMAQSLLVNLNAYQIYSSGLDNGAMNHANAIATAAQLIGTQLISALGSPQNTDTPYNTLAQKGPTGEWGADQINASRACDFSFVGRGTASNVFLSKEQLPDWNGTTGISNLYNSLANQWVTSVPADQNLNPDGTPHSYLKGYLNGLTPGSGLPNNFFVPLQPGDKPHLISSAVFEDNKVPAAGAQSFNWVQPVPNSLSLGGSAQNAEGSVGQFTAYGQVAPVSSTGFAAAIPHGFIRILNGAASPATGSAGGSQDVFVFTMEDPQYYPIDKNGKPLPYFIGANEDGANYISQIGQDIAAGRTPDCSGLSVGYTLKGDTIGLGGVSQANCNEIHTASGGENNLGNGGAPVNNIILDDPSSQANSDMQTYGGGDQRNLYARPPIETAYNIPPAQAVGSNGQSVNVADSVNLDMLTARSNGWDFHAVTRQSGITNLPSNRAPLNQPNFIISDMKGASLASTATGGIPKNGPLWNFLVQRMYQIDPNWTTYCGSAGLDTILSADYVPMGGRAYIYYSPSAYGGKGGLTLKNEAAALADAPWLQNFIGQALDATSPTNPTQISQFPIVNDNQIDLSSDWNFPHPYDNEGHICIMNWYSFTPSSGWNNLLGQIDLGAVNNSCCAEGTGNSTADFKINYSSTGDSISMPQDCQCETQGNCSYSGPC